MRDPEAIRKAIESLVSSAMESRMAELRTSLVDQIVVQFETLESEQPAATGETSNLLNGALRSLQDSTTQTEILKSLLEGTTQFCARSALLIVRAQSAQGWQARGFGDDQSLKLVSIDCTRGIGGRVLESFEPAAGSFHDIVGSIAEHLSAPKDGNIQLLPLIIKDKVAALLYADGGDSGVLDGSAVDILVRSAAMWLELLTLRRAAGIPTETPHRAAKQPESPTPEPAVEEHREIAAAVAAPQTPPREVALEPASSNNANGNGNGKGAAAVIEDELHNKARRFAKLLVDEIKLYNQVKVNEGRQAKDLYSRLKDDIDKSRATYEHRYGQIGDIDYFRQELVRVLADNDPTLLGANFAQPA